MSIKSVPKTFDGVLIFGNGQVCEEVEGELWEDHDPRNAAVGRKLYSGKLWCEWTRETLEVVGRQATLQTGNGLKARIDFTSIVDEPDGEGAMIEFGTVGSAIVGSYDSP